MGLYSPTSVPTYVPTLRLGLGDAAWARVVEATGGEALILQSSADLLSEAPEDPTAAHPTYRVWQYEGDLYRALRDLGLHLKPGALYLAVVADPPLVRTRLALPGPVTYLAFDVLDEGTLAPFVEAANLLPP